MNTYDKNKSVLMYIGTFVLVFLMGCSSQRDTLTNRKLQNLSARYNLLYNSNILLNEYLDGINQEKKENFNNFLPLYYAPESADKNTAGTSIKQLDEISQKARTIIAEKNYSNYIDDAYILLGKADFYQGKYYNAAEYFDYVAKTYKKQKYVYLNAVNWQLRTAIELNDIDKANKFVKNVEIALDSVKRNKAASLATLAQLSIINENDKQAITYLEKALKAGTTTQNKINWTYTLAQLYESEKQFDKSLAAYRKIEKSNAPFEMYFNAKLSKIRINDELDGKVYNRKQQLTKMLKDDKNIDFADQIYYEIAEDYYADNNLLKADEYYRLSVKNSKDNNMQKGLSYLKIADLNFKDYRDYVTAKLYYDSTVIVLPKNHHLYQTIKDKAQNLTYLQERFETIQLQDSLQKIAALPATERAIALQHYLAAKEATINVNANAQPLNAGRLGTGSTTQLDGRTFYFSNSAAIGRGFNEFKKRWGDRKLTPNWRQSVKTNVPTGQENLTANNNNSLPSDPDAPQAAQEKEIIQQTIPLDSLPTTPALLEQSNQKIINAYLEMGSFYQQVLKDNVEAAKNYEELLKRFPTNNKLAIIYYSLYLAYKDTDAGKAQNYRDFVLKNYPESVYAKTIIDPNFSAKKNQLEVLLNAEYENIFNSLTNKEYKKVITSVNDINKRFPGNTMAAQFDYLKAIAIGRTAHVDQLMDAFKTMTETHKSNTLIKPLVDQHISYINTHLVEFKQRKIALQGYDIEEVPFGKANATAARLQEPVIANLQNPTGKKITQQYPVKTTEAPVKAPELIAKKEEVVAKLPTPKEIEKIPAVAKKDTIIAQKLDTAIAKGVEEKPTAVTTPEPVVKEDLFNPASSNTYYYVVAVRSLNFSLSTSRFGIGQFNRGNYSGTNLRHQVKDLPKDQLILVGDFGSIGEIKDYEKNIKSQLKVIMKVPATSYTTFAISKENLDKITDRETLERYIAYISNNEL